MKKRRIRSVLGLKFLRPQQVLTQPSALLAFLGIGENGRSRRGCAARRFKRRRPRRKCTQNTPRSWIKISATSAGIGSAATALLAFLGIGKNGRSRRVVRREDLSAEAAVQIRAEYPASLD